MVAIHPLQVLVNLGLLSMVNMTTPGTDSIAKFT